jgi:hypothetical protein
MEEHPTQTQRIILAAVLSLFALAGTERMSAQAKSPVPTVDGESGPCSVEFTVTDGSGAPVYNAQINVEIDYGFMGLRHLDLQVATNQNGKARFIGLPDSTDGALFFQATADTLRGVAVADPNSECHARHGIYMARESSAKSSELSRILPLQSFDFRIGLEGSFLAELHAQTGGQQEGVPWRAHRRIGYVDFTQSRVPPQPAIQGNCRG